MVEEEKTKRGFFSRIRAGLSKTRSNLIDGLGNLLLGEKEINPDLLDEIETQLIVADVGVHTTRQITDKLAQEIRRDQVGHAGALMDLLRRQLTDVLAPVESPLEPTTEERPYVILMVGVNGAGKTTTIGKLTSHFKRMGKTVMLAAGDTYRAAAVEQLKVWADRNDVTMVGQHTGADSASVIFDALQSARAKGVDLLIADTAGRLQTKTNLMEELKKVVRVIQKLDPTAPHEVMLVIDAGTGGNALQQARQFRDEVGVTGLTVTKLDGTAKGGMVFAIADELGLPIRFIGLGESVDDLQPFEADAFVEALFGEA